MHPPHTFGFAELHTTAPLDLVSRFYGGLFGWELARVSGDFHVFRQEGDDIIGVRPSDQHRLVGYVMVASADETASRVKDLGGAIVTPPFDTPGVARTAVVADPEGAVFGLWEARGHDGHVQDRIGAMWWIELMALDIVHARHFYPRLFGWDWRETLKYQISERAYTVFTMGDQAAGGALQGERDWGAPQWSVFFQVADWAEATSRARALGGEMIFWRDVPHTGRLGTILDPSCASFTVMEVRS